MPLPLPEQQMKAMFKPDSNQDVPGKHLFRGTSWLESVVDGVQVVGRKERGFPTRSTYYLNGGNRS